jgi:hypothetical protein
MITAVEDPYRSVEGCAEFLSALPESVQPRAAEFFRLLDREGELSSVQVAQLLRCERPRIGGKLTLWVGRAARNRGWPLPYDGGIGAERYGAHPSPRAHHDPGTTYYVDRGGNAGRLAAAGGNS